MGLEKQPASPRELRSSWKTFSRGLQPFRVTCSPVDHLRMAVEVKVVVVILVTGEG